MMRAGEFSACSDHLAIGMVFFCASATFAQYQMEDLSRGVVAVRTGSAQVYVGWRLLGTEATANIGFNVYRSTDGGPAVKLNSSVITSSANFVDNSVNPGQSNRYFVRAVVNGAEQADSASFTLPANAPTQNYIRVSLQRPPGGTTPIGEPYTYSPGDASVGDLDGDGDYEIVLKWDPSNQKDNAHDGYTGNVFIDAYEINGARLWRIDLGRNIRAGAHYTQFQVYDYDGDGRAEVVCKTADGTRSGTGQVIGNANADHRNSAGRILTGPEFLTVFNGQTGAVRATANFEPARGVAGDVYAGSSGAEFWGSGEGMTNLFNASGGSVGRNPSQANFLIWWDGDFVRELLDGNHIDKYGAGGDTRLLTASGASSINGSKATPNLSADIFGDWREEVIFNEANTALRIYTTTIVANNRIYTLMHNPQYRVEIARQNTSYNQPPHPSFFLGNGMGTPPAPNIVLVGGPAPPSSTIYPAESAQFGGGAVFESTNGGFNGTGYVNFSPNGGFLQFNNVDGGASGATTLRIRYALGVTNSRTGQLTINGVSQSITFNPTGSWTTWAVMVVNVNLAPGGGNTIIFQSTGQDLANIDQIQIP